MAQVKQYSVSSGKVGQAELDTTSFGRVLKRQLKDAVVMYEAHFRQGTHKTKERGEIRGSTKKPYKQKHTGRARAGSKKSPLWRGGGTIFGPRPRSYRWAMPRKAKHAALRSALAGKVAANELVLIDGLPLAAPSAKAARAILDGLGAHGSCLVLVHEHSEATWKSFRNFPGVAVQVASDVNAYEVCRYHQVVATPEAMERIKERVGEAKQLVAEQGGAQ
ncbi:MAG: 50S ribosomal protein L4 [Planctomycetes bacterium]|nr:50S ribosomal protein L4 [Planctomycetota bacterium]